jgi:hypothetical protein
VEILVLVKWSYRSSQLCWLLSLRMISIFWTRYPIFFKHVFFFVNIFEATWNYISLNKCPNKISNQIVHVLPWQEFGHVCLSGTWVKRGSKTGCQEGIMLLNVQNKLTTIGSTFTIIGGGVCMTT